MPGTRRAGDGLLCGAAVATRRLTAALQSVKLRGVSRPRQKETNMGYYVLHDSDARRAVLFSGTDERPLNHEAFIGADAREQAESFLGWLSTDRPDMPDVDTYGDPSDPRCYTVGGLDRMIQAWRAACLTPDTDGMNERGWKCYEALHAVKS